MATKVASGEILLQTVQQGRIRTTRPYPIPRRKRNLPDTYSRTYECRKSRE
ncbi:unnamed protein product [Hymenolepis diminuta]|uniref:Uncharacterized protein n=1 Tax=Hymenolepis diminuta TaxID=6216 RepID=A0A564YQN2_HYMDI|nr:unnamed protein product [Hymenolepis diminuta]